MSKTGDATEEEYSVEKVLNRRVRNGKVSWLCFFGFFCHFFVFLSSFYVSHLITMHSVEFASLLEFGSIRFGWVSSAIFTTHTGVIQ